ncbi:unnamed protein product [Brassica rapa]|uniref:Uncharacterized protein n=1 Tax=Brassica campestris TaxID=3711 RepID=A0A8D9DGG8_BRACM|nr:unnamed protein product [Brassica rapa]
MSLECLLVCNFGYHSCSHIKTSFMISIHLLSSW